MEPAAAVDSPVASKIRLNVRVTSAPPVQLQTPNFRLVGDIDLRLQGTVAESRASGKHPFPAAANRCSGAIAIPWCAAT